MKKIYVIFPLLFLFLGIHTAAATDIETLLVSPKILNLVEITDPKQLSTEIKKTNLTTEEKTALVSVFLFDAEDIPLLTAAIRSGADVNTSFNEEGITLLMIGIAGNGEKKCLRELIRSGAKVNQISSSGLTALVMTTLTSDDPEKWVLFLLQNGADPKIMFEGLRPVDFAYMNPKLRDTPALQTLEKSTTAKSFLE